MILILTYREYEQSTDPVVDWLLYYKEPFVKIFIEDLISKTNKYKIDVVNKKIFIDEIDVTNDITVVFYRRFVKNIFFQNNVDLGSINQKINIETNNELQKLFQYLCYVLEDKIWFPKFNSFEVNKLEMLNIAQDSNLKIPKSIVTNSKKELINFKNENGRIIYKPIEQISYYTFGKYTYSPYTTEIVDNDIDEMEEFFFPSLFQEKLDLQYEIRVFYLDGEFYSSAILTNNFNEADIKLSYNMEGTKWQVYQLPKEIEGKLKTFMNKSGLNTGSIDIIKNMNDDYYFIEVNPVGQYLAPSFYCNYYVEQKIAKWLIKKNQKK